MKKIISTSIACLVLGFSNSSAMAVGNPAQTSQHPSAIAHVFSPVSSVVNYFVDWYEALRCVWLMAGNG